MPLWAAVAAVNLAIGARLATYPERASDFETVRRWAGRWLFDGIDLYASRASGTDYPPHAIAALSPIAMLPDVVSVAAWAGVNLLLAVTAPVLAALIVRRRVAMSDTACLAVLFLGWSGSKSLLQFTLLTLVFGLAAVALAGQGRRRPYWSGVCLGLAMMKPQIGLPFLLWAVFARDWKVVMTCAVTIAAGSLGWCLRAGADPVHVAVRYLQILWTYYAAPGSMVGISQAGPLIGRFVAPQTAAWLGALLALTLFTIVCVQAWQARRRADLSYAVPAMAGVWSLTTFYHLTYGFVLLLPAAALLLLTEHRQTTRLRHRVFWAMQVALVVDVPGLWRRFGSDRWRTSLTDAAFQDWYRFLLLALFVALWVVHRRILKTNLINV